MTEPEGGDPRLWAPRAGHVAIVTDAGSWPMVSHDDGWFCAPPDWVVGDYRFRLDDDDQLLADPRSRWQPEGVHGPTRPFDAAAHQWADGSFVPVALAEAVLYELHIGTFSPEGTFLGAIDRLDHLVALGVTHVELMPVNAFAGRWGWGYDGVNLFAVHPEYGDPRELQVLVDACHQRRLAVLLDVVYNHLGPEGNHLDRFGPYFTDRYATPWGPGVNFDGPDSDEVRRFFIDNACGWLRDFHLDGLRLDAMHAVVDTSARHWLEQLSETVRSLDETTGRTSVLIAEHDGNDPRLVGARDDHGYGLDAVWNDDVHHALHTAVTGEQDGYYGDYAGLDDVARAWRHGWIYDGRYSGARRCSHGRPFTGRDGDALVVCVQNHDQVGNRARGERIGTLASPDRQAVAAALVLLSPFVPLLFQGEEWGATSPFPYFADHSDEDLAAAVRSGRRAEFTAFGWSAEDVLDPEGPATFDAARLSWTDLGAGAPDVHCALLEWYRGLVALRRAHPELGAGPLTAVQVRQPAPGAIVVTRGPFVLGVNLGPDRIAVPPDPVGGATRAAWTARLAWGPATVSTAGQLELPPDTALVVRTREIS